MLSSINFWMCFAGLVYLVAGAFIFRKEIVAARGWDRLIALASIFIAVSLAVFAPEHFGGPMHVSEAVPSWPNFRSLDCSVTFLVRLEQVRVAEIARRPFSFQQP